jgi:phosphoribosylformylglycinamidine synthase
MKSAVIVFPGSNCDRDAARALERLTGKPAHMVWHKDTTLPEGIDLVVLPGGFSYGDYLRTGAIARFSPVMGLVRDFARKAALSWESVTGFRFFSKRVCYRALC